MLDVVLVDDEKNAIDNLSIFLDRLEQDINIVGTASNITDAYQCIIETNPDVVFLDVEMPGGTGFDLLKRFEEVTFDVIFVTAYGHYAIQAIKFSALDYLVKPIIVSDLEQAVEKAYQRKSNKKMDGKAQSKMLRQLFETVSENKLKKLLIPDMNGFTVVEVDTIKYCVADGNYTTLYFNNDKMMCSKQLKEFHEVLPEDSFYRISKSCIINTDFIARYKKGAGGTVVMTDGFEVDVPRRGKEDFLRFIDGSRL